MLVRIKSAFKFREFLRREKNLADHSALALGSDQAAAADLHRTHLSIEPLNMIDKFYHTGGAVMRLELFHQGQLLGSVVRSAGRSAFAYDPTGIVVGQYADLDAAAAALARRQREAA